MHRRLILLGLLAILPLLTIPNEAEAFRRWTRSGRNYGSQSSYYRRRSVSRNYYRSSGYRYGPRVGIGVGRGVGVGVGIGIGF